MFFRKKNASITFEVDGEGRVFVKPNWGKKTDISSFSDMINIINQGGMSHLIKHAIEDYGNYKNDPRTKYVVNGISEDWKQKPLVAPDQLITSMLQDFQNDDMAD